MSQATVEYKRETKRSLENLNKTWFVDIDGTLFKHRTNVELDYIIPEYGTESHLQEEPLPEAIDFINGLPKKDRVILTTARESRHLAHTIRALHYFNVRYNKIVDELGAGPRIVVNDIKPEGSAGNKNDLDTAYGMNVERDSGELANQYIDIDSKIRSQYNG